MDEDLFVLIFNYITSKLILYVSSSDNEPLLDILKIGPLQCFFGFEYHVAINRNPGSWYKTLLLRSIPGYLFSVCLHRHFRILSGLKTVELHCQTFTLMLVCQAGGSLYHFYNGLWCDPAWVQTRDLLHETNELTTQTTRRGGIWL